MNKEKLIKAMREAIDETIGLNPNFTICGREDAAEACAEAAERVMSREWVLVGAIEKLITHYSTAAFDGGFCEVVDFVEDLEALLPTPPKQ